jgi:tRNA (Thr-GGU) A37 N-methylase
LTEINIRPIGVVRSTRKEAELHLSGLDAIDGTPILDIKPWVEEFGPRGKTYQPVWISELMREYWEQ